MSNPYVPRKSPCAKAPPTCTGRCASLSVELEQARAESDGRHTANLALCAEIARLKALIDTPQTADWTEAVKLEAAHQRERWGVDHDAGKTPADWFWLVGYLAGKALHAAVEGNTEKALHHTISTGAALANWHAALTGADTRMRPGIDPVAKGVKDQ